MNKRNTLICTVGTSLITNIKNLKQIDNNSSNGHEFYEAYQSDNYEKLTNLLLKLNPTERICGAEINTIEEAQKKKWLDVENLIFLISDTKEGEKTGNILEKYFNKRKDIKINVTVEKVEKLQPYNPKDFKKYGLRNLIRKIGDITRRYGSKNIAIDATGGYKAQIALAVLFGQSLGIPVFYKHESFGEIIDFPPMPVSLDYTLIGRYSQLFHKLNKGETLDSEDVGEIENYDREKILVFLDSIEENGEYLHEINTMGTLYLETFYLRIKERKTLKELPENKRKKPSLSQHHYPKGFKEFVDKVWRENKWIVTCKDTHYNKQKSIRNGVNFFVSQEKEDHNIIGTYKNDSFGARFKIILEERDIDSLSLAADMLNDKYRID